MKKSILLSVITINYNNREGLRKTFESVLAQTLRDSFEFVVIDGGSIDGSSAFLKDNAKAIDYYVSEPDAGIYNAMNKGVAAANGEYCIFMNSGDCFASHDVVERFYDLGTSADIICGNLIMLDEGHRIVNPPKEVTMKYLFSNALCHQSAFIRTSCLRKFPYDESLKIVSDRKFFFEEIILNNCSYQSVDIDIALYDVTGFSSRNRFESELEWQNVLQQQLPERILLDYGRDVHGDLYGTSPYERLFLEIKKRRYKKPIFRIVKFLLLAASLFLPSAKFVRTIKKI